MLRLFPLASKSWPCILFLSAILAHTPLRQAEARNDPASICDRAAAQVSGETGVPLDVLRAITRAETGRTTSDALRPWPWTVNMQGKGIWFDTEIQAQRYVFQHFLAGARSFDIGCFQINYKWHGAAFRSIEEMFDPLLNARYAASYLLSLYRETSDWTRAVGAYHSRKQHFAERYIDRYTAIHRDLARDDAQSSQALPSPAQKGTRPPSAQASLVPLDRLDHATFLVSSGQN